MIRNESRFNTRWIFIAVLTCLAILLIAAAGVAVTHMVIQARQTALEKKLSPERLAVYRAVLRHWMSEGNGTRVSVYLADRTESLDTNDLHDSECGKSLNVEQVRSTYQYHFLADDLAQLGAEKIILVDADEYEKIISKYKSQKTLGKNRVKIAARDDRIGKIVEEAIDHGLFSLSEVHFDKEMKHAVVEYGFACAYNVWCGSGEVLLMEKINGAWQLKTSCIEWVT
jgi:heterodisulfide reductase subunit C